MNELGHCPSCLSVRILVMPRYSRHHLYKCRSCTLVFSNRIPSNQDLLAHYEDYGRDDFQSPVTVRRYHEIIGEFEKYSAQRNLLDVGCGVGFFLEVSTERGWKSQGTEISDRAIEVCKSKGIATYQGEIGQIDFKENRYSVISAFEVIEHVQFTSKFINDIRLILQKGGLLYLTTPNFNSLNRRFLNEKWNVLSYPEHLVYFTKKSIHNLLISNGFEKINLQAEGLSAERLLTSKKGIEMDHSSGQNRDEKLRTALEKNVFNRALKKIVNRGLDLLGMGESIKALYRFKGDDTIHP
ncbi:MAG: class I SAM-dependent methyltransferase [Vicingaceae bacterium]